MPCVGGVYNRWTFTLIRRDPADSENIRCNYLHCFLFKDTFVRTTEDHKTGITRFLTGCELLHFRNGLSVATPPYQDVYGLGIVYRVLHRLPEYS
jgi:hypothetical protein